MKKSILSLSVIAFVTTVAQAELLVGVDYPVMSNMTQTVSLSSGGENSFDFSYQPVTIKVGLGTPDESYMYLYYRSAKFSFDAGGESADPLTEIGYDYVGHFDVDSDSFAPFWTWGVAYGSIPIDSQIYDQDARYTLGVKIGLGASYYVVPQVELLASVNYEYRMYQDIDYYVFTESRDDSGITAVVGVNFWPFAEAKRHVSSYEEAQEAAQPSDSY